MRETSLVKNQSKLTFDTRGSAFYNYKKTNKKTIKQKKNEKIKQNKTKKNLLPVEGSSTLFKIFKSGWKINFYM